MPTDIGPRIGIDGEKEFRAALNNMSQQLKTLGSEMKAVTSAFEDNANSQEALSAQANVLNKQIDVQVKRIAELEKGLQAASQKFGDNDTRTLKWRQALNNANADLNKMRSQLNKVESELDGTADSTNDASEAMDDLGDAADNTGDKFSTLRVAAGNLIAQGISTLISGVKDAASALWNMDEATEEYRRAQGRLETAFEAAGYSSETAQQAYTEFYKILGDTDTATEASQLLAQLAESEEDVAHWTEIAAGVSGTFGDSLPIESLIEAANETANVGTVTGVLADALNWVGISEDEFNSKLAECSTESERNRLIMETLSAQYDDAADAFYRNNEALTETRENQARLQETTGNIGEAISNLKNELLDEFTPALEDLGQQLVDFLNGIDVEKLADDIGNFVRTIIDNGPTILSIIAGIGAGFAAWKITGIVQGVIGALTSLVPALTGATAAQTGLNTAMSANPIGIIITLISGLVTALITLWTTNEDFREAVKGIWEAITGFFTAAWETIKGVWDACVSFFQGIWDGITSIFSGVRDALSGWFSDAWEAVKGVFASWGDFFSGLWNDLTGIFSGVWDWFTGIGSDIVNGIKNGISNAWNSLVSWFNNLWDSLFGNRTVGVSVTKTERTITEPGVSGKIPSHALGLDYVPYDGYIAELHKGEMVLTKAQAQLLRATPPAAQFDMGSLTTALNGRVGGAQNVRLEIPLYINGREFARATVNDLRTALNNTARSTGRGALVY